MNIVIMHKIKKWLPIIFGCHCRSDRSFYINGKQLPICARCTGELIGIIVLVVTYGVYHTPIVYSLILMIPMLIDGGIQLFTKYESNNGLRFFTGFFFGYSLFNIFISSMIATYWFGFHSFNY